MSLEVNCGQLNLALRALSSLLIFIMLIGIVILPFKPSQCFNLRRQVFADYDLLFQSNGPGRQQEQQSKLTTISNELEAGSESNSSSELVSYDELKPKDMVKRLLSINNDTKITATNDQPDNNLHLIKINLTAVRDELYQELNHEATVTSQGGMRTVPEQIFREALERVLQRHLDVMRQKFTVTNHTLLDGHTRPHGSASLTTQLISQFFIFGTLFGFVCSISMCTCCLHPRSDRGRSTQLNGVNPTNVPAPIDYSKPYMIKRDSRGSCYASPLNDDEVPPLPTYSKALTCPTYPLPTTQQSSNS